MSNRYYPSWMRVIDLIIGVFLIIAGSWIIIDSSLLIMTILFIIAFSLIFSGFGRILRGIRIEGMKRISRIANVLMGILAIFLSSLVFIFPGLSILLLIAFVAISLMLMGVARIIMGGSEDILPSWLRGLNLIVGIISIGLGFLAIAFPGFGFFTAVFYIAISLITNGFARISSGVSGTPYDNN